jgi:hypothetical protein
MFQISAKIEVNNTMSLSFIPFRFKIIAFSRKGYAVLMTIKANIKYISIVMSLNFFIIIIGEFSIIIIIYNLSLFIIVMKFMTSL